MRESSSQRVLGLNTSSALSEHARICHYSCTVACARSISSRQCCCTIAIAFCLCTGGMLAFALALHYEPCVQYRMPRSRMQCFVCTETRLLLYRSWWKSPSIVTGLTLDYQFNHFEEKMQCRSTVHLMGFRGITIQIRECSSVTHWLVHRRPQQLYHGFPVHEWSRSFNSTEQRVDTLAEIRKLQIVNNMASTVQMFGTKQSKWRPTFPTSNVGRSVYVC